MNSAHELYGLCTLSSVSWDGGCNLNVGHELDRGQRQEWHGHAKNGGHKLNGRHRMNGGHELNGFCIWYPRMNGRHEVNGGHEWNAGYELNGGHWPNGGQVLNRLETNFVAGTGWMACACGLPGRNADTKCLAEAN